MSLNQEFSYVQSDISINENKEKNKDENTEENIKIIKPRNFLITYYKKIYKKGNEIIEELEKNTFDFYFQNEEEIKKEKEEKEEKINKQNEKKEDEKIEFKERKKEEDEIIEWDNEEEEENYSDIEEENSDKENEYKSSINFILSKLKSYKKNNEKRNLTVNEKNNTSLKNYNNEIKKSCLKFRYENKNDSFDTAENSINNEKKNVNFSKFINVFIFKKDDNNKKESGPTFTKTYIKSL